MHRSPSLWILTLFLLLSEMTPRPALAAKRALLVGIGDYSATHITGPREPAPAGARASWSRPTIASLAGPPNDLKGMRAILVGRYGFEAAKVIVLKDGAATRQGILDGIRSHLLEASKEGDQVLFYFSGHGSQRRNTASPEEDLLDETLVPADSLLGVDDIRDKELKVLFNRVLDRGARLTVILDTCHSGSGVRGLGDELPARRVHIDPRDVHDPGSGQAPELRGALILSATRDYGIAREAVDEDGKVAGAFTLALRRSMSTAAPQETAQEVFLRTRARLHANRPAQVPVIAGSPATRRTPLFGGRTDHRGGRTVVAVERVAKDGTAVLAGGRVNGLTVGSILVPLRSRPAAAAKREGGRLRVVGLRDFSGAKAQPIPGPGEVPRRELRAGDLLEVELWAETPGDPFRVSIPTGDLPSAFALADRLSALLGSPLITDPTGESPSHTLRWWSDGWQLVGPGGITSYGLTPDLKALVAQIEETDMARLFLQLPVPEQLAGLLEVGEGKRFSLVQRTKDPRRANYVLVGRKGLGGAEFAWVRPGFSEGDDDLSPLPGRSRWLPWDPEAEIAYDLSASASRLALIYRWLTLESPDQGGDFPYRLTLRREGEDTAVQEGDSLPHGSCYDLVLEAREAPLWSELRARFAYVFSLDSRGRGQLLFPNPSLGDVENLLPVDPATRIKSSHAPKSILLKPPSPAFCSRDPYGADTFFLLTTREALPDPNVLSLEGVRTTDPAPRTPLEELLLKMGSSRRGESVSLAGTWSLQRLTLPSVPPETPNLSRRDLCASTARSGRRQ